PPSEKRNRPRHRRAIWPANARGGRSVVPQLLARRRCQSLDRSQLLFLAGAALGPGGRAGRFAGRGRPAAADHEAETERQRETSEYTTHHESQLLSWGSSFEKTQGG